MADIARVAGVCKATVSLALRRDPQIPAETCERVCGIARELGYRRNPVVANLMAELRKGRPAACRRTIGLINAYPRRGAFHEHPTIPIWVEGCRRRAELLGYGTDVFWLYDPALNAMRLQRILISRGIQGLIVIGAFRTNRLAEAFAPVWSRFACVVTGVRTHEPTLSFCCVDHHELVVDAMAHVLKLGYRRPALAIDRSTDRLVDGRFTCAMWLAQSQLSEPDRVPAFLECDRARAEPALFQEWFTRYRPDVVLTFYPELREWLAGIRVRVPDDVGVVLLERRPADTGWAGMDQRNDLAAEAAVDLVVAQIHGREFGPPETPRATLISARWIDGSSVYNVNRPLDARA